MKETVPDPNRMSFLEHLDELRSRLFKCSLALAAGFFFCWMLSRPLLQWLLQPLMDAFSTLTVIRPAEAFLNRMKAAFVGGVFLSLPVIFYQFWAFLSPGLFSRERKAMLPFLGFSILFFLMGSAFSYHIAIPVAVRFLAEQGMGYEQNVTLDSAFNFVTRMLLGLGFLFEMPILIFFLSRLGIVTPRFLIYQFKYAVLVIFIIAAVITPTPDVITQAIFALPMIVLYWIGIAASWVVEKSSRKSKKEDK